jgi:hypothetical protein
MAAEPDTNGTPLTVPGSEIISAALEETTWTVEFGASKRKRITIFGGRGRISYSRGSRGDGGEARFYRNESTKTYDAVMSGVVAIYSDRCAIEDVSAPAGKAAKTATATALPVPEDPYGLPPWEVK